MISVVIPTYNCANYLLQAISSVINQSYTDFEIIVVDDGSTDNTKSIIHSISDKRLQYVIQNNQGASAARNHGLELAKGEFIAFLDADDTWFPDKLKTQIQVFDEFPDATAVFSNFHITTTDGEILSDNGIYQDYAIFKNERKSLEDLFSFHENNIYTGNIFDSLFLGNFIKTSSFMVRRSAIETTGFFDINLITQEDYDLWLRLALTGPFAYINKPLLNRSKRLGQLTGASNKLRIAKDVVTVVEKFASSDELSLSKVIIKKRLRQKYRDLSLNFLSQNESNKARSILIRSIKQTGFSPSTVALLGWSLIPDTLSLFLRKRILPIIRS
ncbi:MAG: glycosyltransferase [Gammaproteobacteria bacterium]|nr:glycosyltransferase [Gammaproteobacteria bacterium]